MIEIGRYNQLTILRETSVGLYLGDDEGEDVLLPNKYVPANYEIGDQIKVFVHLDYEDRKVATNIVPKINLFDFALLRVADVSEVGAFMDWGMEKELFVPFREQRVKMQKDRWYLVYMDIDTQTDRLYASNKLNSFLQNDPLSVAQGDKVQLIVWEKTDLGYNVIVNSQHKGLVFDSDVFQNLNIGDRLDGYVKVIREDNKLDVSLKPIGYSSAIEGEVAIVVQALVRGKGLLAITDRSTPEVIHEELGMSKKAFKRAIGSLYKQQRIKIDDDGVHLLDQTIAVPPAEIAVPSKTETQAAGWKSKFSKKKD